jgi:hypothetical protein
MPIQDYFESTIAYDPDSENLVASATFAVYAVDDITFATPLALTYPASGAAITALTSTNIGVLPAFRAEGDPDQVVLKSGAFTTLLTSKFGAVKEAGLDAATVQAAIAAEAAAAEARAGAEAARETAESALASLQAVEATNDGIMTAVASDPESEFAAWQSTTIVVGAESATKAWAASDAFVDFTIQPNGAPAAKLDTGQAVDYVSQNVSNRAPVIASGKLKRGTLPASGSYANYYQAQLDGDCTTFGTRYVVDSTTGSTAGIMCLAAWAGVFEAGGTTPPRSPGHITINTLTNAWEWWVTDGLTGTSLRSIKQGTFTAPAKDGVAVWETACLIDAANGIGYLLLPGNDTATGKRIVTLTNAEISAFLTAVSEPVRTFAYLQNGANVLMVEHYAVTAANTAIYPEFLSMYGEVKRPARDNSRTLRVAATSPASKSITTYATSRTQALTASAVNISDGTSNCTIVAAAGPRGVIEFEMEGTVLYTGAETVLGRFAGPTNTANEPLSKLLNLPSFASGTAQIAMPVKHTWKLTGLTPNATGTWTLQMSAATSGGLASVIFGGTGAGYPPLVLKATPL